MKSNNKFTGNLTDHLFYCQVCDNPFPISQLTKLSTYTGRGGLLVCPDDIDAIDYGLVPYKIPAEKPVRLTSVSHYATNPEDVPNTSPPFDAGTTDPMST